MRTYRMGSNVFKVYRLGDTNRKVHVQVFELDDATCRLCAEGWAVPSDFKKQFGYDVKTDSVEYPTNPVRGYQERIRV